MIFNFLGKATKFQAQEQITLRMASLPIVLIKTLSAWGQVVYLDIITGLDLFL